MLKQSILLQLFFPAAFCTDSFLKKPLLVIKIPTRERPERFFKCLDRYYELLSKKNPYFFLVSCDSDDLSMNCESVKKRLSGYEHLFVFWDKRGSKIDAYNRDFEKVPNFDAVLLASDDTWPLVYGYDEIILSMMMERSSDFDCVLKFGDGNDHSEHPDINTLPVVGCKYYKRFGYLYNPSYTAYFCDLELTYVSRLLDKEVVCPKALVRHDHPVFKRTGWDALYQVYFPFYQIDYGVFKGRFLKKFCLDAVEDSSWRLVEKEFLQTRW